MHIGGEAADFRPKVGSCAFSCNHRKSHFPFRCTSQREVRTSSYAQQYTHCRGSIFKLRGAAIYVSPPSRFSVFGGAKEKARTLKMSG